MREEAEDVEIRVRPVEGFGDIEGGEPEVEFGDVG